MSNVESFISELELNLVEFIKTFSGSLDSRMWFNLIKEEHNELLHELSQDPLDKVKVLKELIDLYYVTQGFILTLPRNFESLIQEEEDEEMSDMLDFVYNTASKVNAMFSYEVKIEALRRVHANNLGRCIQPDGSILRREDGKIIKNKDYPKVNLEDLV